MNESDQQKINQQENSQLSQTQEAKDAGVNANELTARQLRKASGATLLTPFANNEEPQDPKKSDNITANLGQTVDSAKAEAASQQDKTVPQAKESAEIANGDQGTKLGATLLTPVGAAKDLAKETATASSPKSKEDASVATEDKQAAKPQVKKPVAKVGQPKPKEAQAAKSVKPKAPPQKVAPKSLPAKPGQANVVDQEPLYLPKPKGKQEVLGVKPRHDIVLLPYISVIFKQSGWQGLYSGIRKELWSKSFARRLVMATVILPGIFIFFYLMFWASPSYISEAKFAVRGQNTPAALEGLSALFSFASTTQNDSYIVLNYIMSLDMFNKLDKELNLRAHYSDKKYDIWYRLWQNATQDDIRTFWEWACEVTYDPDTSILEIRVKAFTPEKALAICEGILKASEQLVNDMNIRSRRDAISKAQAEVERAEERIKKARAELQVYREKTVILDPGAVATGLYSVVNKLEGDVTQTAAELSEAMTYMNKDSPRVKQLENRLTVLQKQLATEKKRLAGKVKGNESLSALLSEFQNLSLEEEFAQKQLTSAMTSLEAARIQADAQTQYVEAFERPVLADQSLYPRPVLFTLLYMVTSLLILGLVSLIVAAIREHAGF